MKGREFKEQNLLLKAGDNPNTNDLNACKCTDPETNSPFIVAKFMLNREEIIKINETGELWLCIMGNNWPPVLPTVFDPFKENGFIVNEKVEQETPKVCYCVQPSYCTRPGGSKCSKCGGI